MSMKEFVGTPSDYSNPDNWIQIPEITKEVDTFYIYPTAYINPAPDASDISEITDAGMREKARINFEQNRDVYEASTNLFAPFYRQMNLAAGFRGQGQDELFKFVQDEPRTDIYAALDYFFENLNQGRPFILAGHSQGSTVSLMVLHEYFKEHPEYLERMVAAYPIGFAVPQRFLDNNPHLKFAQSRDDTGVIVSWNTEAPENAEYDNIVLMEGGKSINPISWSLDEEIVPASQNAGSRVFSPDGSYIEFIPGIADAAINKERGSVMATTLNDYFLDSSRLGGLPNQFGPYALHHMDYGAYYYDLMQNVKDRIAAYQKEHE